MDLQVFKFEDLTCQNDLCHINLKSHMKNVLCLHTVRGSPMILRT